MFKLPYMKKKSDLEKVAEEHEDAHSCLRQFTAGQRNVELGDIHRVIKQFKPSSFWKALGYESGFSCTVVDKLKFPFAIGTECLLEYDQCFNGSSEHFVIYAILHIKTSKTHEKINVIIKFHMVPNTAKYGVRIQNMDQKHCADIIANYNRLHDYIKTANLSDKIEVVPTCIVQGGDGINLWIEKRVDHFRKFLDPFLENYDHHSFLVSTTEPLLSKLQQEIYAASGKKHTICDLQGGKDGERFVLCDIEFTDTLEKFDLKSASLLSAYELLINKTNSHAGVIRKISLYVLLYVALLSFVPHWLLLLITVILVGLVLVGYLDEQNRMKRQLRGFRIV